MPKKLPAKILFFLALINSFSFAAIASTDIAIRVGDRTITKDQYIYNYKRYEDSYRAYYGPRYDDEIKKKMKEKLLSDLIESEIYMGEAENRGLSVKVFVSEEEIEEIVMKNPLFYTEGKLDPQKYDAAKISTEINMSGLREKAEQFLTYEIKRMIIPSKVTKALKDEVTVTDGEIIDEYRKNNEVMRVKYIPVDPVLYGSTLKMNEDDLRRYYDEHKENYMRSDSRQYKILYFDPKNYMDMVYISDIMAKAYYEKNMGEFTDPIKVKIRFVLFDFKDHTGEILKLGVNPKEYYEENLDKYIEPARVKARYIFIKYDKSDYKSILLADQKLQQALNDLKYGVSFIALANKYSDDLATASQGGDLGFIEKGKLNDPFDSVIFSMAKGEVSGVFQTDRGYYIMQVEDKKDERIKFYPEVKEEIEKELLYSQAKPLALLAAKRFVIKANNEGFEEYTKKQSMAVYKTDFLSENDRIPLIGKNQNIIDTAFSIGSEEVSDVVEYDKGYVVFQLADRTTTDVLPYEKIAARVEEKLKQQSSKIFAKKDVEYIKSRLSDGGSLEGVMGSNIRVNAYTSDWLENGVVGLADSDFKYARPAEMVNEGDISDLIERPDGYYLVLLNKKSPAQLKPLSLVSREVAAAIAREYGEGEAGIKAKKVYSRLKEGSKMEDVASQEALPVNEIGPFGKRDYIIGGRYMVDFIGECFKLNEGDISIVKNLGSFCIVKVLWKGIDEAVFNKDRSAIQTEILRAKRKEYVAKWLENMRNNMNITVSVD